MLGYKILPHTADVRLYVTASAPEELFRSALSGMACLQRKKRGKQKDDMAPAAEKIQVQSIDMTSLLIDFLSEVLTRSHINKVVYHEVVFHQLSATTLTATIKGSRVDYFDEDIKAVTYHGAEIKRDKNKKLETTIIFDI